MKKKIKSINNDVEFFDTLCNESLLRQKEVYEIAKKVDLLLVIGGKNSSNTKRLYEIGVKLIKHIKLKMKMRLKKIGLMELK